MGIDSSIDKTIVYLGLIIVVGIIHWINKRDIKKASKEFLDEQTGAIGNEEFEKMVEYLNRLFLIQESNALVYYFLFILAIIVVQKYIL